ncbi:MAG: GntR family transcriptional regulator [Alphaproteobacteria bacterium]|nr:GntR family transcriptional regulator [Alphaproteobacteria bacterium]
MARPKANAPVREKVEHVHLTKSGLARQHIQELILSGAVREGQHLTAREVCEAVGISETPVREAIRGLAAEGWLELNAHHGVVVATLRAEHIAEIHALRGALAALAVELGAASYTAETFAVLDRNIAESERAVAAHDTGAYARLNREFHLLMCDTPHTPWTMRLTSSLTAQTSAQRRGFDAIPNRLRASLAEHRAILATLRQGDTRRAASLLVEHERKAGAALIAALSDQRRAAE